jgi:hypothetical protein
MKIKLPCLFAIDSNLLNSKNIFVCNSSSKEYKLEKFIIVNDSIFLFSFFDFKDRISLIGLKISKNNITFLKGGNVDGINGILCGEMSYVLYLEDKKTIVIHSNPIEEFDYLKNDSKTYTTFYFYKINNNEITEIDRIKLDVTNFKTLDLNSFPKKYFKFYLKSLSQKMQ